MGYLLTFYFLEIPQRKVIEREGRVFSKCDDIAFLSNLCRVLESRIYRLIIDRIDKFPTTMS